MSQGPSIATHVPVTTTLPDEPVHLSDGRPDEPTPSLWQVAVQVRHKTTGQQATVVRVDWGMNMFRAFYPDIDPMTGEPVIGEDGKPVGKFSERTHWEHCREWDVMVTFSPAELERQKAHQRLQDELATLDAEQLEAALALIDQPDPIKALAKLNALRKLGLVKASAAAAEVVAKGKK